MRLRTRDQLHVSSVKSDSLRPGEEFEVSDEAGKALLEAHPGLVEFVAASTPEAKAESDPQNKAAPDHANKAAPVTKATPPRRPPSQSSAAAPSSRST